MQYRQPWLWQLVSVTGASGLSYMVFLVNCTITEGILRSQSGERQPIKIYATIVVVFTLIILGGRARYNAVEAMLRDAPIVKTGILQMDETMEQRLAESSWKTVQKWLEQTQSITDLSPDLVVWPEGAVPFNPDSNRPSQRLNGLSPREFFENLTRLGQFDLLVGGGTTEYQPGTTADGHRRYLAFNSAYSFSHGVLGERYDKMIPLPFGEYIPFANTFPVLKELIQGPGDFLAGETVTVFTGQTNEGLDYTFTSPICYEAILRDQMWKMKDVDLLVNITNDSWFGDTAAPHQHAMLSAIQATELGRPMLRIAYTGVSFVVEPHGQILYETQPFTEVSRVEQIRMAAPPTLYRRGGWLFAWVATLLGAIAIFVAYKREP